MVNHTLASCHPQAKANHTELLKDIETTNKPNMQGVTKSGGFNYSVYRFKYVNDPFLLMQELLLMHIRELRLTAFTKEHVASMTLGFVEF